MQVCLPRCSGMGLEMSARWASWRLSGFCCVVGGPWGRWSAAAIVAGGPNEVVETKRGGRRRVIHELSNVQGVAKISGSVGRG